MNLEQPPPIGQVRTWAMAMHLSQLANYMLPPAGIIIPIVIWQLKKDEMPELDQHGKNIANWLISALIYGFICFLLAFFLVGIPLALALAAVSVIFPIIGGVKASNGEAWKYPLTINFFR